jgi:hypothetical protein
MTGNNSGAHPLTNPELRDRRGNDPFIFVASQCAVNLETRSASSGIVPNRSAWSDPG